jgi:hypothetical protein
VLARLQSLLGQLSVCENDPSRLGRIAESSSRNAASFSSARDAHKQSTCLFAPRLLLSTTDTGIIKIPQG